MLVEGVKAPGRDAEAELARVVREHAGRLAGALVRVLGDFSLAEDVVQDAVCVALERWPAEGVPDRPDAWLFTVARRRGLDVLRRRSRYRDKLAALRRSPPPEPDDRLRLIFTCCHPALPRAAQIALTLRVVCGLTTAQIAAAFLVPETTVAQRITRAKRKISEAGIPYRVPRDAEMPERLAEVLTVVYLLFNEGYLSSAPDQERHLADDAEWLAELLAWLVPADPEVAGLLALIRLHQARAAARFDDAGRLVLLRDQGPVALGPRRHRRRRRAAGPRRPPRQARPVPAPGRHRRLPRRGPRLGGHRLAPDRHPVRHAPEPRPVPGDAAAPGHRAAPPRGPLGRDGRAGRAGR